MTDKKKSPRFGEAGGPKTATKRLVPGEINDTSPATDAVSARDFASSCLDELDMVGAPLFTIKPGKEIKGKYANPPRGWPKTTDANNDEVIARWQAGQGVAVLCGTVYDVIDVDPRNGGTKSFEHMVSAGLIPPVRRVVSTPSGGMHLYVDALDVPKAAPFPGIDYQARGSWVFAPPTSGYQVVERDNWPVVGDSESARKLREHFGQKPTPTTEDTESTPFAELPDALQEQAQERVDRTVNGFKERLLDAADWSDGERDEQGRGWEKLTSDTAHYLAQLGHAPWSPLDLDAAHELFDEIVPDVIATDPECRGKWSAQVGLAASKPMLAPWQEDFDPNTLPSGSSESEGDSEDAPTDIRPAGGWEPVDLSPYLDGTYEPLKPELMQMTDGLALLYPGMTHSIHGESESGKSMIIQAVAAHLLAEGRNVLYMDYEADPGSVSHRLVLMGAPVAAVRDQSRFTYVQPERDYGSTPDSAAAFDRILAGDYALAVLDGVTEALTQAPAKVRSTGGLGGNDDITAWHNRLPNRVARRTGAATVQIDHVAKSAEATRFAIGGQSKMASITGAAYHVKPISKLARGAVGEVELSIAKDRHGFVRERALGPYHQQTRMQLVARVEVDGRDDRINVLLKPPTPSQVVGSGPDHYVMERVSRFLEDLPSDHEGASKRMIRDGVVGSSNDAKDKAVRALIDQGYVSQKAKGQSILHRSIKPFVAEFEPLD